MKYEDVPNSFKNFRSTVEQLYSEAAQINGSGAAWSGAKQVGFG
jgi:hypothetical protein